MLSAARALRRSQADSGRVLPRVPEFSEIYQEPVRWTPRYGELTMVSARSGAGKALALDTRIPTPSGWTTMGAIRTGDIVFGADGKPTTVTNSTEVLYGRTCYRIHFNDGSSIVADAEHQWLTDTVASRKAAWAARTQYHRTKTQKTGAAVRTTDEIRSTLREQNSRKGLNHSVSNAAPLDIPPADLPLDPYVLGVWLGDGTASSAAITTADTEVVEQIIASGVPCKRQKALYRYSLSEGYSDPNKGRVLNVLRDLGVLNNKHVPTTYLRSSYEQRLALLQGLMDSDGFINTRGNCQFAVCDPVLADTVYELVVSLGIKVYRTSKRVRGRTEHTSTSYCLSFTAPMPVFRLSRKLTRQKPEQRASNGHRMIVDVEKVASVPVRCIEVDNVDHMYLAGEQMVPTHNSTFSLFFAMRTGLKTLYFSGDMSPFQASVKLACAELHQDVDTVVKRLGGEDPESVLTAMPSNIDFVFGEISMRKINRTLDAYVELHNEYPELLVIDNLMDMEGCADEYQAQMQAMQSLHVLNRELGVAVWVMAHASDKGERGRNAPHEPAPRSEIKNGLSEKPETILSLALNPHTNELNVAVVKQRMDKSDPSGRVFASVPSVSDQSRYTRRQDAHKESGVMADGGRPEEGQRTEPTSGSTVRDRRTDETSFERLGHRTAKAIW